MFTDYSSSLVHCMWIPYVRDLDVFGKYAWGATVLAFLYRELCNCCKVDRDEIAGCLILLQLWAWERLPTIAPIRTNNSLIDEQFWANQLSGPYGVSYVIVLKSAIKRQEKHNSRGLIHRVANKHHLPDRVLRQFGMIQNIPADPEYSSDLHRLTLQGNVFVDWVQKHQPSIIVWNSRLNFIVESNLIVGDSVVAEYYDWYLTRTR
ncbi:hypothetical protein AgCh_028432 [Apium graveolens]